MSRSQAGILIVEQRLTLAHNSLWGFVGNTLSFLHTANKRICGSLYYRIALETFLVHSTSSTRQHLWPGRHEILMMPFPTVTWSEEDLGYGCICILPGPVWYWWLGFNEHNNEENTLRRSLVANWRTLLETLLTMTDERSDLKTSSSTSLSPMGYPILFVIP
jgi:hypothetical protein